MSDTPSTVTSHLSESFQPVYEVWGKQLSSGSSLTPHTVGKNLYKLLEDDLCAFGLALLNIDRIGKSPERSLLAEILAQLRIHQVEMAHEKNIDYLTGKIIEELKAKAAATLATPICIRIAREVADTGSYSKHLLDLKDGFKRFADLLILRDGNLSKEEFSTLKSLDSILS